MNQQDLQRLLIEAERRGDTETAAKARARIQELQPKPEPTVTATQPTRQPPDLFDQAQRQVGRTLRMGAEAVAALPLTVLDPAIATRNALLNEQNPLPSQDFKRGLDALGLPRAEGMLEQGVDIVGQMVAGSKTMPNVSSAQNVPHFVRPKTMQQAQTIAKGKQYDIPIHFDDVAGPRAKNISIAGEKLPFSTLQGKMEQADSVTRAINKKVGEYVIDEDFVDAIQGGMKKKFNSFRNTAGKLYDKASIKLDEFGDVGTQNFDDAIKSTLAEQKSLGTAGDADVIRIAQKYLDAPRGNFSLMRLLRSQLRRELDAEIGQPSSVPLGAMKRALEKDMESFADNVGGGAKQLWKKADSFYKSGVVPYKTTALKRLVNNEDPIRAWRYLSNSADVETHAARMYKALTPDGRAAVRAGFMSESLEKATTQNGVSPAKFAQYIEKHRNLMKTFFRNDADEIEGFGNLLRHVQRAGQVGESPPTGNRVIEQLFLGGLAAAPFSPTVAGTAATAITSGVVVKNIFQSEAGRGLLLAASKDPAPKTLESIAKALNALVVTQMRPE